jgi:hypothetical protein
MRLAIELDGWEPVTALALTASCLDVGVGVGVSVVV